MEITIKLESGSQFELSSPTRETITEEIRTLARAGYSCVLPGSQLKYTIPAFGSDNILVETDPSDGNIVVYGVSCERDGCLSPQQLVRRVQEVFGVSISENLISGAPPDNLQGEPVYQCGALLKWDCNSNTPAWSNGHPDSPSSPQPSPRPVHLPISAPETQTRVTPTANRASQALVAGAGNYNAPGDHCVPALEDSAADAGFRHTAAPLPAVVVHQVLPTATKVPPQDLGSIPVGDINLETPDQRASDQFILEPKIQLTLADERPPAVETSREESKPRLLNQPEKATSMVASTLDNHPSNQLVVGIGHRRQISGAANLPPTKRSFARQLSLPGEPMETGPAMTRNSSEGCLATHHAHSETAAPTVNESPLSPATKPLAVQRQGSIGSPGHDDLVMPRPVNLVLCDAEQHTKETRLPVLNENPPVFMDPGPPEVSVDSALDDHSHISEAEEFGEDQASPIVATENNHDVVVPIEQVVPDHTQEVESAIDTDSSTGVSPVTPSDQPVSCEESDKTGLKKQVHILEHAMNDHCWLKDQCTVDRDIEFQEAVQQMVTMVEDARNFGPVDENLKKIIHSHCGQCRDRQCQVPHIMAGCTPAGQLSMTTSNREPSCHNSPQQCEFSCDQEAAYRSTTSEADRHNRLHPVNNTDSPLPPSPVQTAPFSPALGHAVRRVPGSIGFPASPISSRPHLQRAGVASPMSGGFQMIPGLQTPPIGHQYQESQLGARSYIQQVSDKTGNMKQNAYTLWPSVAQNGFRKMYSSPDPAPRRPRVARKGEFPNYSSFPRKPGMVVYSINETELMPGDTYPCPHNVPEKDRLGRGGNGEVIKFYLAGTVYALKQTNYREGELNLWSQLDHPNILPLRGVMLGESPSQCYQFMQKLTGDLRSMMIDHGDLYTLLKNHPEQWSVAVSNTVYILEQVLEALVYLCDEDIQHSDLKAHNVLIDKKCGCKDVIHCDCPPANKYTVMLADFDSMKKTRHTRIASQFSEICPNTKNHMEMDHVKGTPAYRAPEQFKDCGTKPEYKRELSDGKVLFDMEGPWCDIWSLGVVLLQMVLGSHNKGPWINKACVLTNNRKNSKMAAVIEAPVAIIRLTELLELSHTHSELTPLARVASACLKIDFRTRPTASSILHTLKQQATALPTK